MILKYTQKRGDLFLLVHLISCNHVVLKFNLIWKKCSLFKKKLTVLQKIFRIIRSNQLLIATC